MSFLVTWHPTPRADATSIFHRRGTFVTVVALHKAVGCSRAPVCQVARLAVATGRL
ncbi:hypothetical protein FM114_09615 [Luteococcus japonicus LSP_Lj1]|uniref:Uncharacterized protein n=1 Tax=Luteococcus japonicus LSP_Lj1 TaxID=1255658 RepID=A0A1R4JUJ0_9ACTN|nr:hypothetical protein FM114_09615 [Luteococcus japonicus LSP_Lj1]